MRASLAFGFMVLSVCRGASVDKGDVPALYAPSLEDIIGRRPKSGQVIDSTTEKDVSDALDGVLKGSGLTNRRACAIAVANKAGLALDNAEYYLDSGEAANMTEEIRAGKTGLKLFNSDSFTGSTSGVLTMDFVGTDYKLAVMWTVPYSFTVKSLKYNAKVYPKTYATSKHMFDQMTSYAGAWTPSGWEERQELGVGIRLTMTYNIDAKVMVYVDSAEFDEQGPLASNAECSFYPRWFGSYCWRECHSGGYCWINRKCSNTADCQGPYPCYASCVETP